MTRTQSLCLIIGVAFLGITACDGLTSIVEISDAGGDAHADTDTRSDAEVCGSTQCGTVADNSGVVRNCNSCASPEICNNEADQCEPPAGWVTIPAGSFWMGSPDGDCPPDYPGGTGCDSELGRGDDEELHNVQLTRSFLLMATEVTQGNFAQVMGYDPNYFGPNLHWGECGLDCPADNVTWFDAVAYANELSLQARLTPCYTLKDIVCEDYASVGRNYLECMNLTQGGVESATVELNGVTSVYDCTGYRLPTEAEWEYAARAGTTTAFFNGGITYENREPLDSNLDAIGWYGGNSSYEPYSIFNCDHYYAGATTCGTQPTGGKAANAWGLHDTSGNVSEWVWDWYEESYPKGDSSSPVVDPEGPPSASERILRGGSFTGFAANNRSAYRYNRDPSSSGSIGLGFRLARSR